MSSYYLPSRRRVPGADEIELELRNLDDGQVAVLVFSDLEALVAGCGPAQPWIAVPAEHLEAVRSATRADVLLLDVALPAELHHRAGRS